ncbi:MAG: hypothetical protein OQK32_04835 [Gammaproteobacteria bacterium]|nr:hypothetical protein [Gammaproteobacteria bacterium]MCW8922711.1 hypothetical protein [Gammaproteobacteria bacterium]
MELAKPILLFIALSTFANANEYAIPSPDQMNKTSQPCITGIVNEINEDTLSIETNNSQNINVQLSESTNMFTIYGGIVFKHQLQPLLNVKVWYKGNSCKEPKLPLTANTIIFASKKPGDTWPIK